MHRELFEFYTPTKDRLSKPMPEWIFHTERGSDGEATENKREKTRKKTGGGKRTRDSGRDGGRRRRRERQ